MSEKEPEKWIAVDQDTRRISVFWGDWASKRITELEADRARALPRPPPLMRESGLTESGAYNEPIIPPGPGFTGVPREPDVFIPKGLFGVQVVDMGLTDQFAVIAPRPTPAEEVESANKGWSEALDQRDAAYTERNAVVAALARCYPSGLKRTAIEGWDPEWHGCVWIDLPTDRPWIGLGGDAHEVVAVRKNNPLKGEEIGRYRVSQVDVDLVIDTDWYRHSGGYWTRQPHLPPPNGYLHRIIATRIFGQIPAGLEVDHIDRDPNNITRANLRLATPHGNQLNRSVAGGTVRKKSDRHKWQAVYGTPQTSLGSFETEKEARAACAEHHRLELMKAHSDGHYIYPPLQASWHYHSDDEYLFSGLPDYDKPWDGHSTDEKYERLASIAARAAPVTVSETDGEQLEVPTMPESAASMMREGYPIPGLPNDAHGMFPVSIGRCARCGGEHKNLTAWELFNPSDEWTHWATCPKTGHPILVYSGSHDDDRAIERFAAALKAKLRQKRDEGRSGWQDKVECPPGRLQRMLAEHLAKGDPVDVGAFAMMLFNRQERTIVPAGGVRRSPVELLALANTDSPGENGCIIAAVFVSDLIEDGYLVYLNGAPTHANNIELFKLMGKAIDSVSEQLPIELSATEHWRRLEPLLAEWGVLVREWPLDPTATS